MACNVIIIVILSIVIIAVILNSLGIYFLCKDRNRKTNQNLILKYLFTNEFAVSVLLVSRWSLVFHSAMVSQTILSIIDRIQFCAYLNYNLIMLIMTFDRLIAIKYPLRNIFIFTRKKVKVALFASTFLCLAVGAATSVVEFKLLLMTFGKYVFPAISTISVVVIVITYTYIFVKIIRKRNLDNSTRNNTRSAASNHQYFKMAAIITFTFVVCYLLPDITFALCPKCFSYRGLNYYILQVLWNMGLVFDPLTYIFMQKLRQRLAKIVCCAKKEQRGSSSRDEGISRITETRAGVLDTKL